MSLKLSPQMKIVALVGVLAVMALGAGSMMLGRKQPASSAALPNVPLKHFHRKTVVPAAPKHVVAKHTVAKHAVAKKHAATPAKHAATPAKPAAKATAPAKAAAKPRPAHAAVVPAVAANGLPGALDLLLHGHRIVVVALWDPEIPSDKFAYLEAQAGAAAAHAGFLGVSILDERLAAPLTTLAGNGTVLPSPGVLVYKQPATLMNRIDGFADRDAIAEAVANAQLADTPPPPAAPPVATTP
jgi:hypothetical protein